MAPTAVDVVDTSANSAASVASKAMHPLDDITPAENKLAVELIRDLHRNDGFEPWFKMIQRQEPRKAVLLPWLDAFHAGNHPAPLPRKLETIYIEPKTAKIHEAVIDVASQKVESHSVVPGNHRTNLDITQLQRSKRRWSRILWSSKRCKSSVWTLTRPSQLTRGSTAPTRSTISRT